MSALADWLSATIGLAEPVTVTRLGTGHSRAMLVATAADGRRVVVRMEQGGVFGTSGVEESRVMRGLRAAGYPVAEIVAEEPTGDVCGQPFFVMAFVDGAAAGDERAVDADTAAAFVTELHRLHGMDGRDLGFDLHPADAAEATALQIDRWRDVYRSAVDRPIPLLEEAAAWLRHGVPTGGTLGVVHGDAGPGNFVHAGGKIVVVTDWEFAHLGDPAEDWAFCLTMRGARTMPGEAWLDLFATHAGFSLRADEWRYWEAFNLFKGACANRTCLRLIESGGNRAPNMAIIGTVLHQVFLRRLVDIVQT